MDFAAARRNMVDSQVRTNKVTDEAVIEALRQVPREIFVPEAFRGIAYVDEDLPLDGDRYLVEPMVFGRLLQAAAIRPTDVVLDLGCGPGYSTAVIARLANTVVALETDGALLDQAPRNLGRLGVDNAVVVEGPLEKGWPPQAPYNVIVLGGAVTHVPDQVLDQIVEGGRLVGVVAGEGVGRAVIHFRRGGSVSSRTLFDATIPLLPGFAPEPSFVF